MGAWAGSSAEKVSDLRGVAQLEEIFRDKRVRRAASVYGRCLPMLRNRAQVILDQAYHTHGVEWRWMEDQCRLKDRQQVRIQEWSAAQTPEYTDGSGSRINDAAAGVTTTHVEYSVQR